jgi:formylglycine-generating enzyme
VCGDGLLCEDAEACDDGNTIDEPCGYGNITCTSCSSSCFVTTEDGTYCGDGVVQAGFEVCDPTAGTQNCAEISNVFLDNIEAHCNNDCSGWNTAMCVPDTSDETKMVLVAPGPFLRGCNQAVDNECYPDEYPYRQLRLSAFYIDTYEVTVTLYKACVAAGGCTDTSVSFDPVFCNYALDGRENHPMNCVDWQQSKDYCEWARKYLPTEAQWEKAARGTDGRKYPWGNMPEASCAYAVTGLSGLIGGLGCGENRTWEVGSKPYGISPYGAYDMIGNVYEWTADWFSESYYAQAPESDPLGPANEDGDFLSRVLRGGNWDNNYLENFRASYRTYNSPTARSSTSGFRCAYSN